MRFMIYGITGYTGRLAARFAFERGLRPIVAGRNPQRVEAEANALGLEWCAFDLAHKDRTVTALRGVDAVLNAAGPYSATAHQMVLACLEAGTHYTDVTAENEVFIALQSLDEKAKSCGVMILPGMGAGGAPTDCLAAHLKQRMPDATELRYYGGSLDVVSRGTAKSAMEAIHKKTEVRRHGELVALDSALRESVVVAGQLRHCVTVPLCDVIVAYWSTGIANITTFIEETGAVKQMSAVPSWARWLLGTSVGQRFIKWQISKQVEGPTDEQRASGYYRNMAVVKNAKGESMSSIAHGPEGYTLTALSVLEATIRASSGDFKLGYQTASTAYGANFFNTLDGCYFEELTGAPTSQNLTSQCEQD